MLIFGDIFAKMGIFRDRQKFLDSKFFGEKYISLQMFFRIFGRNRPGPPLFSGRIFLRKTRIFKK